MQLVEGCRRCDLENSAFMPWLVCFSAALFFFYEFIQGNMFSSIAENIMVDFNVEADKLTYLSTMHYFSNVLFLFVAGTILDRFSAKKTILVAMLLCVLSTFLLASTHSFTMALICRFITGIGSAFCLLGPIRIASRWFPAHKMALVTGAIVTMAMTGGMLAQYPLTKLVVKYGWRASVIDIGCLGIVMLIFMAYTIKEKAEHVMRPSLNLKTIKARLKKAYFNTQNLRAAAYSSLMNMGVAIFGAIMGTLYLMQRLGVTKEEAAAVNSMLFLGAIFGGPIIGWCSDKLRLRVLPMKVGAIVSLFIVLAIIYVPVSLKGMGVLFFLLGFFTAAQVISYALVAESSTLDMTATAVSTVSILTQAGYVIYQNIFSRLLIWHGGMQKINDVPVYSLGDYQMAVLLLPIGFGIALMLLFQLKETYCKPVA